MKIGFIGASVTAQGFNHSTKELTGYREYLNQELDEIFKDFTSFNFSYPGNRLSDAGLLKVDEIIKSSPDVLIIEPLVEDATRGVAATEDEIYFFYSSFISRGIKVITLLMPHGIRSIVKDNNYKKIVAINDALSIDTIEIDIFKIDVEGWFTGVHTTTKGVKPVGNMIKEQLLRILRSSSHFHPNKTKEKENVFVERVQNSEILPKTITISSQRGGKLRLVQKGRIGPFSPILNISISQETSDKKLALSQSIWDPYCHYERNSYMTLVPTHVVDNGRVDYKIQISHDEPNYEECRRDDVKWPKKADLKIVASDDIFIISDFKMDVIEVS
jgi:hypothetical protein